MWQLVLPMDCSNFINSISLKVHVHVGIYMLNGVACLVLKKYSSPERFSEEVSTADSSTY